MLTRNIQFSVFLFSLCTEYSVSPKHYMYIVDMSSSNKYKTDLLKYILFSKIKISIKEKISLNIDIIFIKVFGF